MPQRNCKTSNQYSRHNPNTCITWMLHFIFKSLLWHLPEGSSSISSLYRIFVQRFWGILTWPGSSEAGISFHALQPLSSSADQYRGLLVTLEGSVLFYVFWVPEAPEMSNNLLRLTHVRGFDFHLFLQWFTWHHDNFFDFIVLQPSAEVISWIYTRLDSYGCWIEQERLDLAFQKNSVLQ